MVTTNLNSPGLTAYSRFVLYVLVLPLLFIAGIQLFVLSSQTETYFAWTFAAPISAAFLGAGYWAALFHAYLGVRAKDWAYVRTSIAAALTATTLLAITTYLHLDKFHLHSPLLVTRFVTWVWIVIYIFVPPILLIAWILQSRRPSHLSAEAPLPIWMRSGFLLLAAFGLLAGFGLFLFPAAISPLWPWTVTPLAARAVASWLCAFGIACVALASENDIHHGAGTCASLFAFCILELIALARYASAVDWGKPLAISYVLFLSLGVLITGANLRASRTTSH